VETILGKLFTVRYGAIEALETFRQLNNQEAKTHKWPGLDSTGDGYQMIVAWNSLMISGLARAYGVFRQELAWTSCSFAANFILDNQWSKERGGFNLPFNFVVEGCFQRLN